MGKVVLKIDNGVSIEAVMRLDMIQFKDISYTRLSYKGICIYTDGIYAIKIRKFLGDNRGVIDKLIGGGYENTGGEWRSYSAAEVKLNIVTWKIFFNTLQKGLKNLLTNNIYNAESENELIRYLSLGPDKVDNKIYFREKRGNYYILTISDWLNTFYTHVKVSESTMRCLFETFREDIVNQPCKITSNTVKFHYQDIVMWTGRLKYIAEFKSVKLRYLDFNKQYFDNRLPKDLAIAIIRYDKSQHSDLGFSAYFSEDHNIMIVNTEVNDIDNFDEKAIYTILHEMCHIANTVDYGTYIENDGEDGITLGYFDEYYANKEPEQAKIHGKHFMDECIRVGKKSGYDYTEIYYYGS